MNYESRTFSLGDILNITTGILVTPFERVYEILDFMTGESLFTHALGRASYTCRPYLLKQYPQLAEITEDIVMKRVCYDLEDKEGDEAFRLCQERLVALEMEYGNEFEVWPIMDGRYEILNPIEELRRIRPELVDNMIAINIDSETSEQIKQVNDLVIMRQQSDNPDIEAN